ncbi:DUF3472 domain-containing protein [Streptomyces olivaceoviridis]|uniref:DUF3472 domain-containing protein n=1 Tax=Streptomyces olivaceoviridis TaxID=1921 RepID=UPI0036BBE46E
MNHFPLCAGLAVAAALVLAGPAAGVSGAVQPPLSPSASPAGALGPASAAVPPASILAGNPQHFINFGYGIPGGFGEFTYTVRVDTSLATDSVYYAQYVYGKDGGGRFYSGLQPHPNGKAGVRFSFFGAGATPLHPNCHSGADAGQGVTCAIDDLDYAAGRAYTLTTTKSTDTAGTVYTGTIRDLTTGRQRTIGAWRTPQGFTGFADQANAFIEKYHGITTCADIPAVTVSYSNVQADGHPITFTAQTHPATDTPGTGIYTCAGVSDYTVTTPTEGSYTVHSTVTPN